MISPLHLNGKNPVIFHNKHQELDWKVTLAETGLNAMTGARVKRIQKYVARDDHFLLTYGDGVGNIDLKKLVDFHLVPWQGPYCFRRKASGEIRRIDERWQGQGH